MARKKEKPLDCFRGKVYVGSLDPVNNRVTKDEDWVDIRAPGFVELKKKADRACKSRFRVHDRIILDVANHQGLRYPIPVSRTNYINGDNRIEYGAWLMG